MIKTGEKIELHIGDENRMFSINSIIKCTRYSNMFSEFSSYIRVGLIAENFYLAEHSVLRYFYIVWPVTVQKKK